MAAGGRWRGGAREEREGESGRGREREELMAGSGEEEGREGSVRFAASASAGGWAAGGGR